MKKLCILCNVDDLQAVRSKMRNPGILHIPVSPTGQEPATHMFCEMFTDATKTSRFLALQNLTVMEEVDSAENFLAERNLLIIK